MYFDKKVTENLSSYNEQNEKTKSLCFKLRDEENPNCNAITR